MSKGKWFVVRKPGTGEIIATSANHIVLRKFQRTNKNVVLYSPDSVEGWSGDETKSKFAIHRVTCPLQFPVSIPGISTP